MNEKVPELLDLTKKLLDQSVEIVNDSVPSSESVPAEEVRYSIFLSQVYNNAIRAVMWIVNPEISEGSCVLFDKRFRLAVTNAHVTGKQNITSTTNVGDLVYILGNPGGQDLWRWTLGEFLKDHGDFLHIQSDVFGGNSGGPVLNKQGVLLGIVARSDRHMNALAIPVRDINRLLSESGLEHSRSRR